MLRFTYSKAGISALFHHQTAGADNGFLWYGPLFSGLFLRLIGKREDEIEASPLVYPLGCVLGLVTTYVLAVVIGSAGVTTWWGGAVAGAVVWMAIGALTSANTILYEDRPVGL